MAQDLTPGGLQMSSGGVGGGWPRHDRLLRLGQMVIREKIELQPEQVRFLERLIPEFLERRIAATGVGDLVAVEAFFRVTVKWQRL